MCGLFVLLSFKKRVGTPGKLQRGVNIMWHRFKTWAFRWVQDTDGDLGLQVFRVVTFIKYKDSTLVYWGGTPYERAGKYQGKSCTSNSVASPFQSVLP